MLTALVAHLKSVTDFSWMTHIRGSVSLSLFL